ncbi:MAG: hypothetical protein JWN29_1638 [Acidimicrobiales bacterium]|nr:hypothetical protein [Acidimicrobiales bacterium]
MPEPDIHRRHRPSVTMAATFVSAAALALASCGSSNGPATSHRPPATSTTNRTSAVIDPGDGGNYHPTIHPTDFVATVDNPYLPFVRGERWVYEGKEDGKAQRIVVAVLPDHDVLMGVTVTAARDTVHIEGELAEDTVDWFAQDRRGNVWYFGEAVKEYEHGKVSSTHGSWKAGVRGALPGIVMPVLPRRGAVYRQEFEQGQAEDMFQILSTDGTDHAGATSFGRVVRTEDWTPLEPDVVEHKSYARGIGLVVEETVAGGTGRIELASHTGGQPG